MRYLRQIEVRVIIGKKSYRHRFHANDAHHYTEENVDGCLEAVANSLEKRFPLLEFRMVQLGSARFNFICTGNKKPEEVAEVSEAQ
jgi:hypothetical protein